MAACPLMQQQGSGRKGHGGTAAVARQQQRQC